MPIMIAIYLLSTYPINFSTTKFMATNFSKIYAASMISFFIWNMSGRRRLNEHGVT